MSKLNWSDFFQRSAPAARIIALVCLAWLTGCGRAKEDAAPRGGGSGPSSASTAAPATAATSRPMGDADLLQGVPVGNAATNAALAAADNAWLELLISLRPTELPAEWETNQPSPAVIAEFRKSVGASAAKKAEKVREFYTKYPDHDKVPEAREREHDLLNAAVELGDTNSIARLDAIEAAWLKDPKLPEDRRVQLRVQQLQRIAFRTGGDNMKVVLTEMEKGARVLQKEFPDKLELSGLLLAVAERWLEESDLTKAKALASEVADAAAGDPSAQQAARTLVEKIDRVGKPLDLKFTAVDGRKVDVQAMKGKVVLVSFWATWCEPCIEELPELKRLYAELRDKGFEIVGVSIDHQKEMLEALVEKAQLPWPQHFDDSPDGNPIARRFQIEGVPTMWLVDKKGNLREINAKVDLAAKVAKLMKE